MSNFGRGSPEEHSYEISKSVHQLRRSHFKFFFFFFSSIFSSGGHLVQQSRAEQFLASLVEGHPRNIPMKSFHLFLRRSCLKVFLFLALVAMLISGAEPV